MKFNLKMIAAAVAMVSAAGAAHADLAAPTTGNGSLALFAFNTVTRDYYIRDLGFLMNDFLPSSVTSLSGNGGGTGTRTPEAGLLLNAGNTPNFADASFSAWLAGQNTADIRWAVSGGDSTGTSTATNVPRAITSSAVDLNPTNQLMTSYSSSGNAGGLSTLFNGNGATLSITGPGAAAAFDTNFGLGGATLASLDQSVGLFYFARTAGTSANATPATKVQYGNTTGYATVTLEADGDFVYSLAGAPVSAVPIPAAAWLLGSGLIGLGGMVRRRKAAAQA
jgi:hypothetical protein